MTDRGLPIVDGAPACPFVAFEEDRDERSTSPDHRHRCYAEVRPAPRALAHQEAYCLSSAFPVCPTFQDWARREAARIHATGPAGGDEGGEEPRRNPPRDWSAPPPWTGGPGGSPGPIRGDLDTDADTGDEATPGFLTSRSRPEQGLAGSPADRLAREATGDDDVEPVAPSRIVEPPRMVGAIPSPAGDHVADDDAEDDDAEWDVDHDTGDHRPVSGPRRGGIGFGDRRPKVGNTRPRRTPELAPSWERQRRSEAYPTLKTRVGLPDIPRLPLIFGAVIVAAIALFFLPALLGIGKQPGPGASGSQLASGSPRPSGSNAAIVTPVPAPTPQLYTVKSGDTMIKIASRFGVPPEQLIAANKDTVPDPNKLQIGQQIIIPVPTPTTFQDAGTPSPSAAP